MCQAIEEMKKESESNGRIEGEIKGIVETCMEFHLSLQETIQRIADKFNLTSQQAEKEVNKYWK